MKTRYDRSVITFLAAVVVIAVTLFQCTSSKKNIDSNAGSVNDSDVANMVNGKRFTFVATYVNPLRGRTRQLTSEYDVTIKRDSLVSFLPYFGRAYQAPMDPSQGGIQFTSTNFSYDAGTNKNGSWNVIIKPKDYQPVQQFTFTIFGNGSATLQVMSTSKDPISFNGRIEKNK